MSGIHSNRPSRESGRPLHVGQGTPDRRWPENLEWGSCGKNSGGLDNVSECVDNTGRTGGQSTYLYEPEYDFSVGGGGVGMSAELDNVGILG